MGMVMGMDAAAGWLFCDGGLLGFMAEAEALAWRLWRLTDRGFDWAILLLLLLLSAADVAPGPSAV